MADQVWCYGEDEDTERWRGHCATREAAIAEAPTELELMPGDTFWVSSWVPGDAAKYLPTPEDIIEQMNERAYDNGIEEPEFEATTEGEAELKALLTAWCAKHLDSSRFYEPDGSPERFQAPAEDPPSDTSSDKQGGHDG